MEREYVKWFSPAVQRDMELLVFGWGGTSVLFFPTRTGRFYEYEELKIVDALQEKINCGALRLFCVDSIDKESFYNDSGSPPSRMGRHLEYESYIIQEVIPFIHHKNPGAPLVAAGCSLGAYHAVNIALRHPWLFTKIVGMSGRYDLTRQLNHYDDLLQGYWDETVYFNMPEQYIPNLSDPGILESIRKMEVVLVVGQDDVFLQSNQHLQLVLQEKGISCALFTWNEEAHRARYWKEMVKLYL